MDQTVQKLGFWSSVTLAVLVVLIDIGMVVSNIIYPVATITDMETYAAQFTSTQMLPFIPSLLLAFVFVIFMFTICNVASSEKKILGQISLAFTVASAVILSFHYYIQLTFVRQSILAGELDGVWLYAAPNMHGFFWTLAALGYGFMGLALLFVVPLFEKTARPIKWLLGANSAVGIAFLVGNAFGGFMVNIFASFVWGALFPVATVLIAKWFKKKPV